MTNAVSRKGQVHVITVIDLVNVDWTEERGVNESGARR